MLARRCYAKLLKLNIWLGLLRADTKMRNAGFGVTARFEKSSSSPQNCARRREASLEVKTTVSTANLVGTRCPQGQFYSRETNRLFNFCYPICSDTQGMYGTILLDGPKGTRIIPPTSKSMH